MSREIVRDHSMLLQISNMNADERLAAFVLKTIGAHEYARLFIPLFCITDETRRNRLWPQPAPGDGMPQYRATAQLGLVHISARNVDILDMPQLKRLIAGCHRHGPE